MALGCIAEEEYIAAIRNPHENQYGYRVWNLTGNKKIIADAADDELIFVTDQDSLMDELSQHTPDEPGCTWVDKHWKQAVVVYATPRIDKDTPLPRVLELAQKYGAVRTVSSGNTPEAWREAGFHCRYGGYDFEFYHDPNKDEKEKARKKQKVRRAIRRGEIPHSVLISCYPALERALSTKLDCIARTRTARSSRLAIVEIPKMIACLRTLHEPFKISDYAEFLEKARQFRHGIKKHAKGETWQAFATWLKQEIKGLCQYRRDLKFKPPSGATT